jgi:hypothetical protein
MWVVFPYKIFFEIIPKIYASGNICTKNQLACRYNMYNWSHRLTTSSSYWGLDKFYRIILFEDIGLSTKNVE